MGHFLESCYREENVHSIVEMKILGKFYIIDSYGVAVTNLEVADEETPNFPATSLLPYSYCLYLCVKQLYPPPSLPPYMPLTQPQFLPSSLPMYTSASVSAFCLPLCIKILMSILFMSYMFYNI